MADTIASYNPSDQLSAGLDTVLNGGNYYVVCEGVGNINAPDYGSMGHYHLVGNLSSPLANHFIKLNGTASSNLHLLSWTFQTDEPIKEFEIQISSNGVQFRKLLSVDGSKFNVAYEAPVNVKTFYRVKAITRQSELAYYSNIISLPVELKSRAVKLLGSIVSGNIRLYSTANCRYQLMMSNGQLIAQGNIGIGLDNLGVPPNVKGILLLRIIGVNDVWTEKILKQ
jgi:hypothetical protein